MTVQPDQADPKYKHNCIPCKACVKLPLDVDGIDVSIDTQILKSPHIILFLLAALDDGINLDIVTLNNERGDIF